MERQGWPGALDGQEGYQGAVTAGAGRLVAVVVTYNRLPKLKVSLARLLEVPAAQLQAVVVVDNASTDGTGAWLAGQGDPRLVCLTSAANIGGAGGFETGMKQAVARFDPDWILVMDDDARPRPGALAAFHAMDHAGHDAVAAAVYYPDGAICEMNRPSRNPFWHGAEFRRTLLTVGGRGGFHVAPADYDGPGRSIDVASFVGLFVSRAAIARVGYPTGGSSSMARTGSIPSASPAPAGGSGSRRRWPSNTTVPPSRASAAASGPCGRSITTTATC